MKKPVPLRRQNANMDLREDKNLWKELRMKEEAENVEMRREFEEIQNGLMRDFLVYQRDMALRRNRYISKHGIEETVFKGSHIPFWSWWENRYSK